MTTRVTYEGGLRCRVGCGPNAAELLTDVPAVYGGKGEYPGPMDLLEAAVGSCIMGVVALVAERHSLDVTGTTALVCREMDETGRHIGRLAVSIAIPINAPPDVRVAIECAARACPVHSVLDRELDAPIAFQWGAS